MLTETTIRNTLKDVENDLLGWSETEVLGGWLLPTEPDATERALIRIRLRGIARALRLVLGGSATVDVYDTADHRDGQRIAEDALRNAGGE